MGHVDIADFLSHYVDLKEGDVLDHDGEIIGKHKGALVYTAGQRHGFTISKQDAERTPMYVHSRDLQTNTITVSSLKPVKETRSTLSLVKMNYIAWTPQLGSLIELQTRYRQKPVKAEVVEIQNDRLVLKYTQEAEEASLGQSCVLYDGTLCLGGGIIA